MGKDGKNKTDDINLIQKLLHRGGLKNITVSGQLDAATQEAIISFKMVYGLVMDFSAIHPEEFHILKTLSPNSLGTYKRQGVFDKVIDTPDAAPKMAALYDFISKNNSKKEANAEPQQETEDKAGDPVDLAVSPSSYEGQDAKWKNTDLSNYIDEAGEFKEKYKSNEAVFQQLGFANGDELIKKLSNACEGGKEIRYMAFFGHGGDGMYADRGLGFEATGASAGGNETTASAEIIDLEKVIQEQKIKFHKDGIILFMHACNSYHHESHVDDTGKIDTKAMSFAEQLAVATQTPVVGAIGTTGSSGKAEQYHTEAPQDLSKPTAKEAVRGYYLIVPLGKGKGVETVYMGREITLEKAKEFLVAYRDKQKTKLQRIVEKRNEFNFMLQTLGIKITDEWVEDLLKSEANQKAFLAIAKKNGFEKQAKQLIEISKPLPTVKKLANHEDEAKPAK